MPCPFRSQGLLLNPYGDLHYCENSNAIGNVLTTPAEELYFRAENLAHREEVKRSICPTCLSPCQVNVGAMKQFVPYAKFLSASVSSEARSLPPSGNLADRPALTPSGKSPHILTRTLWLIVRVGVAAGLTGYMLWKSHPGERPCRRESC